jgi:hypothetical protein
MYKKNKIYIILMNQVIVIAIIFFLIYWFQNIEDTKYKKNRITFYEKYKYPVFVSALVGLVFSYCNVSETIKKIKPNIREQQIYIDPSPF